MVTEEEKFGYQCIVCTYFNFEGDCICCGGIDPNNLSLEIPQEIKDGTISCNSIQDKNGKNQIEVTPVVEVDIETDDMTTWAIEDDYGKSLLMPACRIVTVNGSMVSVISISNPTLEIVCSDCVTECGTVTTEIVEDL
jgi:hypothetical protein